jgi:hypothetical protein
MVIHAPIHVREIQIVEHGVLGESTSRRARDRRPITRTRIPSPVRSSAPPKRIEARVDEHAARAVGNRRAAAQMIARHVVDAVRARALPRHDDGRAPRADHVPVVRARGGRHLLEQPADIERGRGATAGVVGDLLPVLPVGTTPDCRFAATPHSRACGNKSEMRWPRFRDTFRPFDLRRLDKRNIC